MTETTQTLSWPPNLDALKRDRLGVLLKCRMDPNYAAMVKRRCADDPIYFLETFGWVEARQAIGSVATAVPVVCYPQQREFILHLVKIFFEAGADENYLHNELIEKARMTAGTWSVLMVFIWFFLFHNASFLILSKKEDDVDRAGDLDTPFEKMRFFISRLPDFLLPDGFDLKKKECNKTLLLATPQGAQISGDSSAASATRQKRALAILFDEFAYCENDAAIWSSAAGTVKVRIAVSTPNGTNNKYYRLRYRKEGEDIHITSFTWQKHPVFGKGLRKAVDGSDTSDWYEMKKAKNSAQTMAKEYDLNYADSIGARIFKFYTVSNTDDNLEPEADSTVFRIWDPGLTFACVWGGLDRYDSIFFYDELVLENTNLDMMVSSVLDKSAYYAHNGCRFVDLGDPANIYRRTSITQETEYSIMQKKYQIYVQTHTISNWAPQKRTKQSIDFLADKTSTYLADLQRPQLIVNSKKCPLIHSGFSGDYAWDTDANGAIREGYPKAGHPIEDVMDCCRYLALHSHYGTAGSGRSGHLTVVKKDKQWGSPNRYNDDEDPSQWKNNARGWNKI